jgi:glutathione synthase/RimK-type ligase-like ATP-grasp enzyme
MTLVDVRLVSCRELPAEDPDTPIVAAGLAGAGVQVVVDDWRNPAVDWGRARLTLLRSPWDYVDHYDEFVAWVGRVRELTELWNPPDLVTWNVHKSYLLDLASRGAPIVPTVLLLQGSAASLDGMCDAQGWNAVVVKPAVGVGGIGSGRFDVGDAAGQAHLDGLLARGDVLVQPFVPAVEAEGERSVIVLDGVVTHALAKVPAAGEYRVHEEYGGRVELVDATPGQRELAARVVAALPSTPMYARIDMLRGNDGWMVLEVEATEPSLWLDLAPPAAAARLVDAIITRLRH